MRRESICFISGSSPVFLGGISLYQKNLIEYAKKRKLGLDFTWIFPGKENRKFTFEKIRCIEIKVPEIPFLKELFFAKKVKKIISRVFFDIINTHANWGSFLKNYQKIKGQKIIHTYHGADIPYWKTQFERFGFFKYLFYPVLSGIRSLGKPPIKKANKIICVSEHVEKEIEETYGKRKNVYVIQTGVGLERFKRLNKSNSRKELKLEVNLFYGLYVGRGGYWIKGLDRAINLGREIYNLNKNFRLIVIGTDENKCKKYLNEPFVIYKGIISQDKLNKYYSANDFFFSLSRYEGGDPTLSVGEAMASGCLLVCSKDSNQEIIKDKINGLIISEFGKKDAKKILETFNDKKLRERIIKKSREIIKELSLDKWGEKYFEVLDVI
ncbi:MAG: glycosyltransferase family 4 protein [Nanoarchaeota archaeon]|nr:glycosyltransferase family 4 protein [Nanoarchaeota archaeon]